MRGCAAFWRWVLNDPAGGWLFILGLLVYLTVSTWSVGYEFACKSFLSTRRRRRRRTPHPPGPGAAGHRGGDVTDSRPPAALARCSSSSWSLSSFYCPSSCCSPSPSSSSCLSLSSYWPPSSCCLSSTGFPCPALVFLLPFTTGAPEQHTKQHFPPGLLHVCPVLSPFPLLPSRFLPLYSSHLLSSHLLSSRPLSFLLHLSRLFFVPSAFFASSHLLLTLLYQSCNSGLSDLVGISGCGRLGNRRARRPAPSGSGSGLG